MGSSLEKNLKKNNLYIHKWIYSQKLQEFDFEYQIRNTKKLERLSFKILRCPYCKLDLLHHLFNFLQEVIG
jgi:hypothetical protein